ncbi:MAG: transcription termination/antitermination protein NusG [Nitrospirae bacterium CG_4_10_14_0_8_um_filter_41_23]|nr:transcription termination/antitermination protein NusG [Nitrospirota bacterium]OIP61277.1 MAG: transcription termination/antitermination factor NusG [Nitrospirae bacterium CG2_30_41_42]PIQ94770.1 MAG: transcription termination/antitermination protein NusG [Nitrospirae bacterium CG11_big_fil_rev_8_21_14_0_20_41_14]PIV43043.1 MAG: transcription termination/antitermination protein NusG [Nitrospirae bacterium CG02_land_8_20_14_3_00_41_53]PIW88143.1 MAG: transcription termination/antitermination 
MGKNWYVVHTYSGFEEKVKLTIEEKKEKKGLTDRISRILIPTERVIELKAGKKKESDKKFYPGYILVEMEMDDETWHLIRSTPRVTGFIGGTKPVALSEEEIAVILQQIEKGPIPQVKTQFRKGESVRIVDGPFSNFLGTVEDVDIDHVRLCVMVSIFGRQTPVELNFFQVERA